MWEQNRFLGTIYDDNGNVVNSTTNERLCYQLEGGKTYTLQVSKINDNGMFFEFLDVKKINTPVSIDFTPCFDNYTFYEGNLATDDILFSFGSELEVEFSDGDVQTFRCNGRGNYILWDENHDYDNIELRDYANQKGAYFDCNPHSNVDADFWQRGSDDNYIEIYSGAAYQRFYVDDYIQPSPYKAISVNGSPIQVYDGTSHNENGRDSNGEWRNYQRFVISKWDLEQVGNSVTVTYLDDTTKTYTCVCNDDLYQFVAPDGDSFMADEFIVRDNQGPDNEWELGGEYDVDVWFRGQHSTYTAEVVPSLVDYIEVATDGDIVIFENCNGHWEFDNRNNEDYFRYDEHYDYLRSVNAVITVHYGDGSTEVYDYANQEWMPITADGKWINQRYFEFYFDQDGDHHFNTYEQNDVHVKYMGKDYVLNANVVEKSDIDHGEMDTEHKVIMQFLSDEEHIATFTPESNGVYEFRNSLADRVRDGEFDFTVTNSSGDEVNRIQTDRDGLFYNLYADEEYTITARNRNDGTRLEYLDVEQRVSVKKIEYSHDGGTIQVTEGDIGNGREIYDDGSTITVTFSEGTVETFTAERGEFRCDDGRQLHEFANDLDVYCDCSPRATASANFWQRGVSAYYTLTVGNVSKRVSVTVSSSEVESIVYNSRKPAEMVKNVDFGFDENDNSVRIHMDPFFEGDTVAVTYSDERGTVTYRYDGDDRFVRDTDDGREEIHLGYSFDDTHDYNIGDTMTFTIAYQTGRCSLNATVVENNVDYIEFTPAYPYSVFKECNGWWEHRDAYDEENHCEIHEDYYKYHNPSPLRRGNALTVYYTGGTSVEFVYNGRWFMDENGNKLDDRYIRTEDDQWNYHWTPNGNNEFYVLYMNVPTAVPVTVIDRGEWQLYARAIDSRGNIYNDGDTLYIERGQRVFVYFDSDPRNREHGIADIIGFSDGYDEGTLTQRGFDVQDGNDFNFGYNFGDVYGLQIGTNNLRIGTRGVLNYYLYEFEGDNYDNFDFVNTPHAADYTLNVEIVDHHFEVSEVVPATCTAKGYTEYTCTLCGITYRSDFTEYAAHSFTAIDTPATENSRGYTTYTCNCGYEYIGNITGYASDDSVLQATISRTNYYSSADYSAASFENLTATLQTYQSVCAVECPQIEIDNAAQEILTAISELQPYLNLNVNNENGTILVNNSEAQETAVYLFGEEITLTAIANNGYKFAGWFETTSGRLLSAESSYTFKITSNTDIEARFVESNSASIYFTNSSGYIAGIVTKTTVEWNEITTIAELLPAVPYEYGSTNGRWVYDDATVLASLQSGADVNIISEYDVLNDGRPAIPTPDNERSIPALTLSYYYDSTDGVASFIMAAGIPEGCEVESISIAFYYQKASDFDPTDFDVNINNKMLTSKFEASNSSDYYIVDIPKFNSYYNWAVKGYVTYYDASGKLKTAYTNQVNVVDRQEV